MRFVVKKLPEVDIDALKAATWYDSQQVGLGDRFLDELEEAVQSLTKNALLHFERFESVRRVNLPTFPYGVFYRLTGETVEILGILHGARNPRIARRINRSRKRR